MTTELRFNLDGMTVSVPIRLPESHTPVDTRVGELALKPDVIEWLSGQSWFDQLVDDTVHLLLNEGLEAEVADMLRARMLQVLLALYLDRLNELTPDQLTNRIRWYRPELVSVTQRDYEVSVDMVAVTAWVSALRLNDVAELMPIVVRNWLTLMVCQVDGLGENDQWGEAIAEKITRYGSDGLDTGILSVALPVGIQALQDLDPSLDTLERVLGLVAGPRPEDGDLMLPTGVAPAAVGEGLVAAVNNDWAPDEDGVISYSSLAREGLSVKLVVSEDGISPITVAKTALTAVASVDDVAAQLHQILSDYTLRQPNPWVDRFWVSTDEILERLSLGRKGRRSKALQVQAVIRSLQALSRVLVRLDWEDDPKYRRSYSDLWSVGYNECLDLDGVTGLPTRYDLRVTPGGWAEQCLERVNGKKDVLWYGYAPAGAVKQASVAGRMLRHYHETTATQFTVYDWLVGACGRGYVDRQLANKALKHKLKGKVFEALPLLADEVKVGFDLGEQPKNWVKTQVVKRMLPAVPIPIYSSDLKRTRVELGLTQEEAAEITRYSRSYLSRVERDPGAYPEAAIAIRRKLIEHTKTVLSPEKS
jgi:DNA-binding XRE family transcriptional regulator